jgi:crotonobetainyl-CoA:carnitine CoA-transferase CaiB-like acyl-CoA transferase
VSANTQMNHRGLFEVEDHPVTGPHPVPIVPFRFASRAGQGWLRRPAPTLGQHNGEVLHELLGLTDGELANLRDVGLIGDRPVGA